MKKTIKTIIYSGLIGLTLTLLPTLGFPTLIFNSNGGIINGADDFDTYRPQFYWDNRFEPHVYTRSRRYCQTYVTYGSYCINTTKCYTYKGRARQCYYYRDCRNRPYYQTSCHYTRLFGE